MMNAKKIVDFTEYKNNKNTVPTLENTGTDGVCMSRSDIRRMMKWKSDTPIVRLEKERKLKPLPNVRPYRYQPADVNYALFGVRTLEKEAQILNMDDYDPENWK